MLQSLSTQKPSSSAECKKIDEGACLISMFHKLPPCYKPLAKQWYFLIAMWYPYIDESPIA